MANVVTSTDARSALVRRLKSGYCGGCSGDVYRKSGEPVEHSAHCEAAALIEADGKRIAQLEAVWLAVAHCCTCSQCNKNFGARLCDHGIKLMEEARSGSIGKQSLRLAKSEGN